MATEKLSRKDWIAAGFKALQQGGPQALKIEAIAKAMKVSKGSFYWHFKDAGELKSSMLSFWVTVATKLIIKEVERDFVIPEQTLHYLVEISSANLDGSSEDPAVNEASIRDLARYDTEVAEVVKKVDKKRLEFVAIGFERAGFNPIESKQNAKSLYAALIGLDYLANHGMADIKKDLPHVLNTILQTKVK